MLKLKILSTLLHRESPLTQTLDFTCTHLVGTLEARIGDIKHRAKTIERARRVSFLQLNVLEELVVEARMKLLLKRYISKSLSYKGS